MAKGISVYLSDQQLKMVEELAKDFGKSASEIVRVLMHLGYDKLMGHPRPKEAVSGVLVDLYKQEINK